MDDDDVAIGGGAAAAYNNDEPAYNPFGGDKKPANGIEDKPLYTTTVITGGGKKGRKRKGGNQGAGQQLDFTQTKIGGFF